jgi:UrcA family protein
LRAASITIVTERCEGHRKTVEDQPMKTDGNERKPRSLRLVAPAMLAVVCVSAAFDAGAHLAAPDDLPSVKVGYGDLNLTTRQGKDTLRRRIHRAADLVCGTPDARNLQLSMSYRSCMTNATNDALSQIRWPQD